MTHLDHGSDDHEASGERYGTLDVRAPRGVHERVAALVTSLVEPGATVIDAGAGSGALSARLLDGGFAPYAADLDAEAYGAAAPFARWDIDEDAPPPELPRNADALVHIGVLEHLRNPQRALREFFALLRPGGVIIVGVPNVSHPYSRLKFLASGELHHFERGVAANGHITALTATLLAVHLGQAGFEDVRFAYAGALSGNPAKLRIYRVLEPLFRLAGRMPPNRSEDGANLLAIARRPPSEA